MIDVLNCFSAYNSYVVISERKCVTQACLVLTTFSDVKFELCGGITNVMHGILRCVADESLVVRYDASKSLRHIIDLEGWYFAAMFIATRVVNNFMAIACFLAYSFV
jgi:hypothetical protein